MPTNDSGKVVTASASRGFGDILLARIFVIFRPSFVAPPLILLCMFAPYVRYHRYDPLRPEILIIGTGIAGIGLCIAALARLRPTTLEPFLLGFLTFLLVFFRLVGSGTLGHVASATPFNATASVAATVTALLLGIMILAWVLRGQLAKVIVVGFGAFLISTFVLPVQQVPLGVTVDKRTHATNPDLPPLIHIILDEHIGVEGIPTDIPGGREAVAALKRTYNPAEFALFGRAYSRFVNTQHAIPTMLNGAIPDNLAELVKDGESQEPMAHNLWFERLKTQGYQLSVFTSSWLDLCGADVDFCYKYPVNSIEPIQRMDIALFEKIDVVLRHMTLALRPFIKHHVPQLSTISSLEVFDELAAELFSHARGNAYIVHLLLPHFSYLYERDCTVRRSPAEWLNPTAAGTGEMASNGRDKRHQQYFSQMECLTARISDLFSAMQSQGIFRNTTVILHGDHGSRLTVRNFMSADPDSYSDRDIVDLLSTLYAVKAPHIAPGYRDEMVSIQTLFGRMFLGRQMEDDGSVLIWHRTHPEQPFVSRKMVDPRKLD